MEEARKYNYEKHGKYDEANAKNAKGNDKSSGGVKR